jgi:hypothetical protein
LSQRTRWQAVSGATASASLQRPEQVSRTGSLAHDARDASRVGSIHPESVHRFARRFSVLLIREIMYCKPGKVRPLVEKFIAMSKLGEKAGMPKMKVMTDFSAERYWTIVAEMEVESLKAFEDMMSGQGMNEQAMKEMEELMKGYHDLVNEGRREIYKLEN